MALDGGRVVQAERSNLELIAGKPTAPSAPPPPPVPSAPPLPPVPPPPPPPPAYDSDAVALGATPLPPALLGYEDSVASKITIEEVRSSAERAWGQTQAQGRGRVERLPTFQGRVRDARNLDSTNGCAVIAPLVCQMHIGEKKELTNSRRRSSD